MTGRHQRVAELRRLLAATGKPWAIERGSRHFRIMLDGEQIGLLSHGSRASAERDFYFIERALRGEEAGR
jgi:hypothetical protein